MVVPVILYGSSTLRKHSAEVTEDDNIRGINNMLFDTLKKSEGIGLAASQISILKRVFIIDTSPLAEQDKRIEKFEGIFINPSIIERNTEFTIYREGCLSFPDIFEEVERPGKIRVRYQDIFLNSVEEDLEGVKARVFQHEFDHLNGVLFIDKIGSLRRNLLKSKLNRIKRMPGYYKT